MLLPTFYCRKSSGIILPTIAEEKLRANNCLDSDDDDEELERAPPAEVNNSDLSGGGGGPALLAQFKHVKIHFLSGSDLLSKDAGLIKKNRYIGLFDRSGIYYMHML